MKDKNTALKMLQDKLIDPGITYEQISRESGYEKRQLIRLFKQLKEKDMDSILIHGNTGHKPVTTASDQETSYLEQLKESYPVITIAQFRDIFIEDVIRNPLMKEEIEKYGLKARSRSWFRKLFIKEGWKSPLNREIRTDGRSRHPIRKPRDTRGELVQIDGTPYDWLGDGRMYTLHLAVDDAGTEVLAGWFSENECTYGYCRVMDLIFRKHGIPESLYSDRDTVFISAKAKTPSQFAMMMAELDIRMIFANSAEAKGRIERYNGTAQNRLPNDIIRFRMKGYRIDDYDDLNIWFNEVYIKYLNAKFSFPVFNPHDSFRPLPQGFDPSKIFRGRFTRVIRNLTFSFENSLYSLFEHETGVQLELKNGTQILIYLDIFKKELYIERYNKRYDCIKVGERRRDEAHEAQTQKQLNELLINQEKKGNED